MEVIVMLLIGMLTTAIMAWYKFFYSFYKEAQELDIDNPVTRNGVVSHITFFCLFIIASPLMFIPVIVPSVGERFAKGMREAILAED